MFVHCGLVKGAYCWCLAERVLWQRWLVDISRFALQCKPGKMVFRYVSLDIIIGNSFSGAFWVLAP